jgi:tetratricopeptide (TPR) repeat protein
MIPTWKQLLAAMVAMSTAFSVVLGCELLSRFSAREKQDVAAKTPLPAGAEAKFRLSKALQETFNHKLPEAQDDLSIALKLEPENAFIHFKYAELCALQSQYDLAISEATRAVALAPAWTDPYYFLVEMFLATRRPQDAEHMAKKLLEMNPEDGAAVVQLSRTYQAQQLVGPSILVLEEFLESYPEQVDVRRELARLLARLGRFDDSEAAYKELVGMVGSDPALWEEYAQVQILRGKLEEAAGTYQKELDIIPSDYMTRLELVKIFLRLGKKDQARNQVELAKSFAPGKDEVWQMSAELYLEDRQYEKAKAEYLELLRMEPKNTHAMYNLGLIEAELKDWDQARKWFSQIPKNSELDIDARVQVVWVLYNQGKKDQAVAAAQALLKEHPGKKLAWLTLGGLYQKEEKFKDAVDLLNDALTHIPEDVDILYSLAMVYSLSGDDAKAIEVGKLALDKKPDDPALLNFIGYTLLDAGAGDVTQAEGYIKRALDKEPDNGAIIDSMGWVCYKKGQYQESLKLLNKALEKLPDDPEISKHLGQLWLKLGDKKKAGEYFEKALAQDPRTALKTEIENLSKETK